MKNMTASTPTNRFCKILAAFLLLLISLHSQAQTWSGYGYGPGGWAYSQTVYNGELYAGGEFGVLKFDGTNWVSFGGNVNGSVWALTVYNNELIAGGFFTTAGGLLVNYIARWNGTVWKDLEGGTDSYVVSLAVYNGELVAGGYFKHANISAKYIAKWNGNKWSTLGAGMGGTQGQVMALTVYGTDLIATGFFTKAGNVKVNQIAKWDGTAWSALGSGLGWIGYSLTVYKGNLIAGGLFSSAGGVPANDVASWNGSTWSALGYGIGGGVYGYCLALTTYNEDLIAGGIFTFAGGMPSANIARWNGTYWAPLASFMSSGGTVQAVYSLTTFNGKISAAGIFDGVDGVSTGDVAAVTYTPTTNTISTSALSANDFCYYQVTNVPYTVTGTFNSGNVFTVQISDANGSFFAPVNIGSLASTTSGSISVTIPAFPTIYGPGNHYRVRVVSSNPAIPGTDNGTDLTVGALITANGATSFCSGGSVVLSVPTPAISYQWKNSSGIIAGATQQSYTATASGDYSCDVTKSCGVNSSNIITVASNPKPTSTVSAAACSGGKVLLTCTASPNAGVTYKWTLNGSSISGATNSTYSATVGGTYKCKVTITATGCNKNSKGVDVTISCKLNEQEVPHEMFYPNPSSDYFIINSSAFPENCEIRIYDLSGQLLESHQVLNADERIGASLPGGIYFAKVYVGGEVHQVVKLVKNL